MKNLCFLTIALFFIILQIDNASGIEKKCPDKDLKTLDGIVEKLFGFGKKQRDFPTSEAEAKPFCR